MGFHTRLYIHILLHTHKSSVLYLRLQNIYHLGSYHTRAIRRDKRVVSVLPSGSRLV